MAKEEINIRIRQVVKAVREQVLEMNWSGRVVVNKMDIMRYCMESAVGEKNRLDGICTTMF